MLKNRVSFVRLLFTIIVVILLYNFISGFIKLRSESSKAFVSYPKVTDTYSEIFSKETLKYLERDLTFFSKGTNPVATFNDRRDSGKILVFKYDFHITLVLAKAFEISNHIGSPQRDMIYNNTKIINNFDIYRTTSPLTSKIMILSFKGENIVKTVQNDSLVCYNMILNAFSLVEKESGRTVLEVKRNNNEQNLSELLLLQKGNSIYLLLKNEISHKSNGINLYNLFIK